MKTKQALGVLLGVVILMAGLSRPTPTQAQGPDTPISTPDLWNDVGDSFTAPERQRVPVLVSQLKPIDPLQPTTLTAADITGPKKWAWILCKFADDASEPKTVAYFEGLRDTLNTYFKENSYDKANIDNSTVSGWYTLPQNRAYYVYDKNGTGTDVVDFDRAAADCTALADPTIDFSDYYSVNLMFNGELASAFGTTFSVNLTLDGLTKFWPAVFIDNKGSYNTALTAHEMYHGFGLGHSGVRDTDGSFLSGSSWDPVGVGACGFGDCDPSHTPAPQKDILGWIDAAKKSTYPGSGSQTVTLEGLALPQTANPLMAIIPIGTNHYYTVEARRSRGNFDDKVPDAVVIHEVKNGAVGLIPVPGKASPSGSGAAWVVGDKFSTVLAGVEMTVKEQTATGFTIEINELTTYPIYLPLIIR